MREATVPILLGAMYTPLVSQVGMVPVETGGSPDRDAFSCEGQDQRQLLLLDTRYRRVPLPGGDRLETQSRAWLDSLTDGRFSRVVMVLISSGVQPNGGKNSFGSGFLPSVYQGVQCRSQGDPVLYVSDPKGMDRDLRRASLDALRDLNAIQAQELGHPETLTRIAQYELAFRMQLSVPEVMDITRESQQTLEAYGASPARPALPTTACWPAGWPRTACATCSCSTGAGTSTAPVPARTSATA